MKPGVALVLLRGRPAHRPARANQFGPNRAGSYLLSDHLGSTTALVSHSGVVLTAQRYSSWGQTRAGSVSTGYQYTGQRNTALGIYYYGARFYDPQLGRFLSADSIIPQPGNPQGWDRYSYTRNNPIRYNDPTGHDIDCGIGERCRLSTLNALKDAIKQTYKINVIDESGFSLEEMKSIYYAIGEMETGLNSITDGSGLKWIRQHFGGVAITIEPKSHEGFFGGSAHVLGSTIYLPRGFTNSFWGNSIDQTFRSTLIHEFGHVFDNHSHSGLIDSAIWGGGYGDGLMSWVGGKSTSIFGFRWSGGVAIQKKYEYPVTTPGMGPGYAQNSTADYFAQTFAAAIVDPSVIPDAGLQLWMAAIVNLTK